jgi:hypothetical protein
LAGEQSHLPATHGLRLQAREAGKQTGAELTTNNKTRTRIEKGCSTKGCHIAVITGGKQPVLPSGQME